MAGSNTDLTIRIRGQLNGAIRDLDRLESKLSAVARSASRAERGWRRAAVSIRDFATAGLAANVVFAALQRVFSGVGGAVRGVVEAGLSMERLERRFRFAAGSAGEGARAFAHVREEATRLGFGMREIAAAYNRLSTATRGTSLEGARTREIFTAVAEAARVMGLTTEEASDALTAVGRIAAKGVVSVDDLRGQLGERIPGALQIAACAMGKTDEEFNELLETGRVLATDLLPAMARQMRDEFAAAVPEASSTAEAAFGRLGAAIESLRGSIARSGVLDWLASVSEELANLIREDTPLEVLAERVARVAELGEDIERLRPAARHQPRIAFTLGRKSAELKRLQDELVAGLRQPGGAGLVRELLAMQGQLLVDIDSRLEQAQAEAGSYTRPGRTGYGEIPPARRVEMLEEERAAADRLLRLYSQIAARTGLGVSELSGAPGGGDGDGDDIASAARKADAIEAIWRRHSERLAALTETPLERIDREERNALSDLDRRAGEEGKKTEKYERARTAAIARFAAERKAVRDEIAREEAEAAARGAAAAMELRRRQEERLPALTERGFAARRAALEREKREELAKLEALLAQKAASEEEGQEIRADILARFAAEQRRLREEERAAERQAESERLANIEKETRAREAARAEAERRAAAELREREREEALPGARAALERLAEDSNDAGAQIGDAVRRAMSGAEDAFVQLASTGKLSFRDLTQSILADLTRIAVRQSIVGPLASGLFGALGLGDRKSVV